MTEKRALYVKLIRQGVSNSEACRRLGIDRKTGHWWKNGGVITRNGVVRVVEPIIDKVPIAVESGRYLSEHRDGGCVWKGCTAPVSWCDAHHLIHWAKGGETTLGNLILLCRRHHTRIHKLHPQDNPRNHLRDTGTRNPDSLAPDT